VVNSSNIYNNGGNITIANDLSINGISISSGNGGSSGSATATSQSTLMGYAASAAGNNNTMMGFYAGNGNTGTDNTVLGTNALRNADTATYSTAVGESAGGNHGGSYNTFVGYNAIMPGTYTNATAIGAQAYVGASNSLVLGSISGVNGATTSVNVGIGTSTPSSTLQVVGKTSTTNFQMTNGGVANAVMTSDASGNGSWSTGSGLFIQNQTSADQSAGFRINGNGILNGGGLAIGTTTLGSNLLNISPSAAASGVTGSGINMNAQAGGSNASGGSVSINAGQGGNPSGSYPSGGSVTIVAGAGGTSGTVGTTGGNVTIAANGSSYCLGCGLSGGSVNIYSGGPISGSSLTPGNINFYSGYASPTQRMIIQGSNGYVGIGTASPGATLDVSGTTRMGSPGTIIKSIQMGQNTVGAQSQDYSYTLTFPNAFANAPKVIATCQDQSGSNYPDNFSIVVVSTSTTGCVLKLHRTDSSSAWGQTLLINWIAFDN
jgi:hypothetical protein